jgi:hypothetical protein
MYLDVCPKDVPNRAYLKVREGIYKAIVTDIKKNLFLNPPSSK